LGELGECEAGGIATTYARCERVRYAIWYGSTCRIVRNALADKQQHIAAFELLEQLVRDETIHEVCLSAAFPLTQAIDQLAIRSPNVPTNVYRRRHMPLIAMRGAFCRAGVE
jgi:hypothetical protein